MAMNVVVLVKQVPDTNAIKIERASGTVQPGGQHVISSYDQYAIEAAIRLKEAHGAEVTVLTLGPAGAKDALSRALAMGADKAIHLVTANPNASDTLAVAEAMAGHLRGLNPDIVLAGQGSDDYEGNQVGPQVAELLGLPVVSNVNGLEWAPVGQLTLTRDIEDGRQTVEVAPPVVLLAISGLNEPRYPSLKGIMAAKKKPTEQIATDVPVASERIAWSEPVAPEQTIAGVMVRDVPAAEAAKQLAGWLREQKLI